MNVPVAAFDPMAAQEFLLLNPMAVNAARMQLARFLLNLL
jgi:hypothetical protein